MGKLDLYKEHKEEYVARRKPVLVDAGPARYLAIEGHGEPGSEMFATRVGALYGVAFTIKMTRKLAGLGDYKVCHLEGLWWADKDGVDFLDVPRREWQWKLLIRTPDFVTAGDLRRAKETLRDRGKAPEAAEVKLARISEGRCVQMLHIGPYDAERETIAMMDAFAEEQGLVRKGLHHEIYLSDPRRVPPERLRTILRHPARRP